MAGSCSYQVAVGTANSELCLYFDILGFVPLLGVYSCLTSRQCVWLQYLVFCISILPGANRTIQLPFQACCIFPCLKNVSA